MLEVCGDGVNLGTVECDDGNKLDGDGCSSDCRVELGFQCRSQGMTLPDVCLDNLAPAASVKSVSKNNAITIVFTEVVITVLSSTADCNVQVLSSTRKWS